MYRARLLARRVRNRVSRQGAILLYHRIADGTCDPWSLCVSPGHFAEHLDVLAKRTCTVRLAELQHGWARSIDRPVALTFDDGYGDNHRHAMPMLERWDIPATFFVTTGAVDDRREFWWDDLARTLLSVYELPGSLRMFVNGSWHRWELTDAEEAAATAACSRGQTEPAVLQGERHALHGWMYALLRPLPHTEREQALAELRAWAGIEASGSPVNYPMSADELGAAARCELIEIGAHTIHHSLLARLPLAQQRAEIGGSKAFLEDAIGRRVDSFAYPFGGPTDYTKETVAVTRAAGFARACSTIPGPVRERTDPFQLPRFYVRDWDGEEFGRRLSGWFDGNY